MRLSGLPNPKAHPGDQSDLGVGAFDQCVAHAYLAALVAIAEHSEGEVLDPPRTVHDCPDQEDNLILDLAVEVGALLIVSNDVDLISMSPWRGTPVVTPEVFRQKVDGMRRHARRRR
jgi:predicted nucleic acid-binding protein